MTRAGRRALAERIPPMTRAWLLAVLALAPAAVVGDAGMAD
jgi:hypothetical protein